MVEHEPTGPIDLLTWTFSRIAMWGPAFIVVIIFYEVVMRYIFFSPTLWVNEMSLWAGGAIYVTAGLYSMQQRSHIRIFILYDMAPLWMRRLFDIVSAFCVAIFFLAVLWGGYGEAAAKFYRWEAFGTAWDPPIPATNKPLVLATLFVLTLQGFSNLIRDWPAAAWLRKTFDIAAAALVIWLCIQALPVLFAPAGELAVPMNWRITIAILLSAAVILCVLGLVRDFNRTPVPFVESHDPTEEVLSGAPPPVSVASGAIDPDRDPRPGEKPARDD